MRHKYIVVTADDFGKSKIANENILKLIRLGKVDRVSVMVNGAISSKEKDVLLNSKAKLDIHLELPQKNKEYGGIFIRLFLFAFGQFKRKYNLRSVNSSWENQVQKFIKIFNKHPEGLNSHEHIHFFPPYFKLALKICRKYHIERIRFGEIDIISNGNSIGWILKFLNRLNKNIFSKLSYQISGFPYIASLNWFKMSQKLTQRLPKNGLELVSHPERREEYLFILRNT